MTQSESSKSDVRARRIGFAFFMAIVFIYLFLTYPMWTFILLQRDGILIQRESPDHFTIRFSNTKGPIDAGVEAAFNYWRFTRLRTWDDTRGRKESLFYMPPLSHAPDTWIFDINGRDRLSYVNPRLRDPKQRIRQSWGIGDNDVYEREVAAESYIYFGYAVRNLEELRLLVETREKNPDFDRNKEIVSGKLVLHRFEYHMEKKLAKDPDDETELEEIRANIPVLIERANASEGHPMDFIKVLYLDGSITEIPFGARFPANRETLDLLYPDIP